MISEERKQDLYLELINEYGASLRARDRASAKQILADLIKRKFSFKEIYWLLWNLGERNIIKNKGLLYYKPYQDEARAIAKQAENQYFNELDLNKMIQVLSNIVRYDYYITQYDIERIQYFDNESFNEAREDYTKEEQQEIRELYINYYIKPNIKRSKAEYERERQYIIDELKRTNTKIDFKTIQHHPYTEDYYKKENEPDENGF